MSPPPGAGGAGSADDLPDVDERLVVAIRDAPTPVANTHHLADAAGLSVGDALERLDRLAADGVVEHVKVRGLGHLWWLPDARGRDG